MAKLIIGKKLGVRNVWSARHSEDQMWRAIEVRYHARHLLTAVLAWLFAVGESR